MNHRENKIFNACQIACDTPNKATCKYLRDTLVATGYPLETKWWTNSQTLNFACTRLGLDTNQWAKQRNLKINLALK